MFFCVGAYAASVNKASRGLGGGAIYFGKGEKCDDDDDDDEWYEGGRKARKR